MILLLTPEGVMGRDPSSIRRVEYSLPSEISKSQTPKKRKEKKKKKHSKAHKACVKFINAFALFHE
jgi:hypothetical protein